MRIFDNLCSAADVCQRLNAIASNHPSWDTDEMAIGSQETVALFELSLDFIENMLRTFGTEIRTSKVLADLNHEIVLRMCVQHCLKIEALDLMT